MQQSEEYELPRGEHSVAHGPAEKPVLPPAEQPALLSTTNFEGLRVHLQNLRTQKRMLLRRHHHPILSGSQSTPTNDCCTDVCLCAFVAMLLIPFS